MAEMGERQRPGLIMCVCTGKCPGFDKMDIWDFINRVRIELPVEYGFIHPQLCEEDGDRFLADFLEAKRRWSSPAAPPTCSTRCSGMPSRRGHGRQDRHDTPGHPGHDHRRGRRRRWPPPSARWGWRRGAMAETPSWACRGRRSPGRPPSTTTSATSAWSATSSAPTGSSSAGMKSAGWWWPTRTIAWSSAGPAPRPAAPTPSRSRTSRRPPR